MKKLSFTLIILLSVSQFLHAQWTNGTNINNTNTGNVGIGTSTPQAQLDVSVNSQIGAGANKFNTALTLIKNGDQYGTDNPVFLIKHSGNGSNVFAGVGSDLGIIRIQGFNATVANKAINSNDNFYVFTNGTVGINTNSIPAGYQLAVNGSAMVNGNIKAVLEPVFPTKNNVSITNLGFSGPTGALNWAIRGVYQYGGGVNLNADGGDLDIIKSLDGNTILGTKSDGTALGNVGIGTIDPKGYKLAVNGSAIATSMTVKLYANWPDYVFKKDYQLPSLTDVKTYIDQNQHLPDMPSEAEVAKNGLNLGEMNKLLVKKMEEMTLYMIEAKEEINELKKQVQDLKKQNK